MSAKNMSSKNMSPKNTVIRSLDLLPGLEPEERLSLQEVTETFAFRVSKYYAGLVDWSDPDDPLRKLVLPDPVEVKSDQALDASAEESNTHARGLQHKYRATALLLVNDFCAAYCRFCFRKRFTLSTSKEGHIRAPGVAPEEKETTFDVKDGIAYIREHPEITSVLLTGGDPLMLSPGRLQPILDAVLAIPHVRMVRIGTKVPAFDPERITPEMIDLLGSRAAVDRRIFIMAHFNHPRELTPEAGRCIADLQRAGLPVWNQTPLLRGVNDDPAVLTELFLGLVAHGVTPYYLFHCRPTTGNENFSCTLQEGLDLVTRTRAGLHGLARAFRYVGSHESGKIEIVGRAGDSLVLRYQQARDPRRDGLTFLWPYARETEWFDGPVAGLLDTADELVGAGV